MVRLCDRSWGDVEPTHQEKQHGKDVKGTEYLLVVPRKPFRQVDVEIGPPIIGVTRGDHRQGAPHAVQREDTDFTGDDGREQCGDAEVGPRREQWDGDDTGDEKGPNDGVAEPYRSQGVHDGAEPARAGPAQPFIAFSMWSMARACSRCGLNRMTSESLTARTLWPGGQ